MNLDIDKMDIEPRSTQLMQLRLAVFLKELRSLGFNIGIRETLDAQRLALEEGAYSKPLFQSSLRHLLCSDIDEWQQFDRYFLSFFSGGEDQYERGANERSSDNFESNFDTEFKIVADFYENVESEQEGGAGRDAAVSRTDFRFLTDQVGWEEAASLAEKIAKRIKFKPTRRWKIAQPGKRLDLAATARKMARTDGDPLKLIMRKRKKRPVKLVALLDVSHSMSYYSPMLTRFIRGLIHHFDQTEAFCFHIELNRITDLLKEEDRGVMRERMEAIQNLWFGGTNIADSIHEFNKRYLPDVASSHTVVLLFTDGCDITPSEDMRAPFEVLRSHVRRVFWVNPMNRRLTRAGLTSSSPLIGAKSFIDGQISGDSLHALESLARVLSR